MSDDEYNPPDDFTNVVKPVYKPTYYPVNREFRLTPKTVVKKHCCNGCGNGNGAGNVNLCRLTIAIICILSLFVITGVCIYYGNQIYTKTYQMYHQTTFTVTSYQINSVYESEPLGLMCRDCDFKLWSDGLLLYPITCDLHNYTSKIILRYPVYDNDHTSGVNTLKTRPVGTSGTPGTPVTSTYLYTIVEPGFCGDSYENTFRKDSIYWPIGRSDITGWYLISDPKVIEYQLQDGIVLFLSAGLFGFLGIVFTVWLIIWVYRNCKKEPELMFTPSSVTNSYFY